MSLILDALKKSDRNRERGKVPDLQADHSGAIPQPPLRHHRRWLLPLMILLLVAGGWLAWQFFPASDSSVATPPVSQSVPIPASPPVEPLQSTPPPAKPLEPAVMAPPPRPNLPIKAAAANPAKSSTGAVDSQLLPSAEPEIYDLGNLPSNIGQGLPELVVSVHYFTPNPESRMVRINNKILREGGALPGGIKIVSIERNGIICETQGVLFRIPTTSLAIDRGEEK